MKKEIKLKKGRNGIDVPTVLTMSLTVELSGAPTGFGISEVTFGQGMPAPFARPTPDLDAVRGHSDFKAFMATL